MSNRYNVALPIGEAAGRFSLAGLENDYLVDLELTPLMPLSDALAPEAKGTLAVAVFNEREVIVFVVFPEQRRALEAKCPSPDLLVIKSAPFCNEERSIWCMVPSISVLNIN